MPNPFSTLSIGDRSALKNRFVLAPLTNTQSHSDGTLSDDEYRWLVKRAEGGFGLTMTCAALVQRDGQGFPGQLGVYEDRHIEGLARLADGIKAHSSHSVVQLHHAGMRAPQALIGGTPICPSDNSESGARAMTYDEVSRTRDAFVAAARRCERAGFDGVEIHGAHGYLLCEFLSSEINVRDDRYGGDIWGRSTIIFEIIEAIRSECRRDFSLGVRLSPERFGLKLAEIRDLAARLMSVGEIDYLDMSLWDIFKEPVEEGFRGRSLLSCFTDLDRGSVKLGAAGKISTGADVARAMDLGLDFVVVGRAAILHHDLPELIRMNSGFVPASLPVTADYLRAEGLGESFISYMRSWKGFVADEV
ncbi:MAG: NADH:flavin oxidoreductase [Alphaproteobacteria bacterium]|nr:NADH:flavin oxidoreductase [Alphaproteobacteria bacterium]